MGSIPVGGTNFDIGPALVDHHVLIPIRRMADGTVKRPGRQVNHVWQCCQRILAYDQPRATDLCVRGLEYQITVKFKSGDLTPMPVGRRWPQVARAPRFASKSR